MSKIPLQKHTLNLREGDWEYIESVFQARGVPTSTVVRRIVSRFVETLRTNSQDKLEMDKEL